MRAANKGSAAQFSVKSLANDIPSLTHGVKTQRDFYDKLGKLGVAVSTAMHNVGGFSDEDRNYIDSETNRLQAMAKQKAPTAGTNGQPQSLADRLNDALGKKK
jgi:hypothetical protein